jgi:hypothetical protein
MPVAKDGTITGLATQIYSWLALQKMVELEGRTGMKFSSRRSGCSFRAGCRGRWCSITSR